MKKIEVTASRNYTVHIGSGILPELGLLLRAQVPGERVCIVTDDTVQALYGAQAEESLTQAGFAVCGVFGGTDFSALTAESEKAFFVLKRI